MLAVTLAAPLVACAPSLVSSPVEDKLPDPIDFEKVPRKFESLPDGLHGTRYGMFLFGEEGEHRVWAVLSKREKEAKVLDLLCLDLDADGKVGEEGERFEAKVKKGYKGEPEAVFEIGDLRHPEPDVVHTDVKITWTPSSVRYRMMWRGKTLTMGGFGPSHDVYAGFGESPADATIYVPGFDRPLEFERWGTDALPIGGSPDFKVFLGARGSNRGAFSSGDDDLLRKGRCVVATLVYKDTKGKERKERSHLRGRC